MLSSAELNKLAEDTGCSVYDACLACPLDECILITGRVGVRTLKKRERNDTIRSMAATMNHKEIAKQLGISLRTVDRALEE